MLLQFTWLFFHFKDIFGFLFSVKKLKLLDCTLLKEKCLNRKKSLKHDNLLDADGLDLFLELNILKGIIGLENDKPIDILNYIKGINSFPNAYIAYRIMLIIPVSVASAERIFLKLKIIYKNLLKINNVSTKIEWIDVIVYWKRNVKWN